MVVGTRWVSKHKFGFMNMVMMYRQPWPRGPGPETLAQGPWPGGSGPGARGGVRMDGKDIPCILQDIVPLGNDRENGSIWGVCLVVLGPRWGTPGPGVEFGVGMT